MGDVVKTIWGRRYGNDASCPLYNKLKFVIIQKS